jgi:pantetheine-phosphate adenylyltransferase
MTQVQPKIGIYPGTFDPITNGHLDIIRRALTVVDILIIAIAADTNKTPLFSQTERADMVQREVAQFNTCGKQIEARPFTGLLVDFAKASGSSLIIRGLRAVSDFEYEFQMSCMNSKLEPAIETVFLPASDRTQFISSRFVKEIARLGGDISGFVPPYVESKLLKHLGQAANR